jgi:hypothetical protein
MTIGAAVFFVVLLASATWAARRLARNRKFQLAGIALIGLTALAGLHDANRAFHSAQRIAMGNGHADASSPWTAADIHALLDQGTDETGGDRVQLVRTAVAQARDQAAIDRGVHATQLSGRQLCIGRELAGVLSIGIPDARSAMLEDLVSRPCWAPGFLPPRQR